MKSLEQRFNEALAALKEKAPAAKYDSVWQECQKLKTLEEKTHCAETALKSVKESGPIRKHAGRAEMFVEGNPFNNLSEADVNAISEATVPAKDEHGRRDFRTMLKECESIPDRGAPQKMSEAVEASKKTRLAKVMRDMRMTEDQARVYLGLPEKLAESSLTSHQLTDFRFFRAVGFKESEALAMAKQNVPVKPNARF